MSSGEPSSRLQQQKQQERKTGAAQSSSGEGNGDPEGKEIRTGEATSTSTSKPDLYVIARIISVLKEKGSLNRTTLATDTSLAYNRLSTYLSWMSERGFLTMSEEDGLVSLTAEGIATYEELVGWILRYVGKLKFPRLT